MVASRCWCCLDSFQQTFPTSAVAENVNKQRHLRSPLEASSQLQKNVIVVVGWTLLRSRACYAYGRATIMGVLRLLALYAYDRATIRARDAYGRATLTGALRLRASYAYGPGMLTVALRNFVCSHT
jgi:hypothetical protein